jgi:hypothetical protein
MRPNTSTVTTAFANVPTKAPGRGVRLAGARAGARWLRLCGPAEAPVARRVSRHLGPLSRGGAFSQPCPHGAV